MATTHGPFTFDAFNDSDCQRFDFESYNGGSGQTTPNVLSNGVVAAEFCWDSSGSGHSSGTGPTQGQGGLGDGFLFTECSSPGANGDEYTMEFDTVLDASVEQWQFNFYTLQCGNTTIGENQSTCEVQISEDGGGWITIEDVGGSGEDTTDQTAWTSRSVDLSAGGTYVDPVTTVRLLITTQTNTQAYYGDYGVDTVTIVGSDLSNYQIGGITRDKGGSVLGSCGVFLFSDNDDGTFTLEDYQVSNASTGVYLFENIADNDADYCVRAWKDDTPHVMDITDYEILPEDPKDTDYDLFLRSDSDKGESNPDPDLRLRTQAEKEGVNITDVDTDEDFYIGQTGVVITGSSFETDGANSRVRIDSSSAGTGTSQTQVDTSWADTSIQFTASLGALSYGTNYLFVRNQSLNENDPGFAINLYLNHTTTSLNDSSIFVGQTGVIVNGTNFNATQGSSKVYLCDSADGSGTNVEQTVTDWTASAVTFTVVQGGLSTGTNYVLVARNQASLGDTGERFSNSQSCTLSALPAITDVDTDEDIHDAQTAVVITGTDFETEGGNSRVRLNSAVGGAGTDSVQTDTSWADTSIQFSVVKGSLSYGTNYLFVRNESTAENTTGFAINLYLLHTTTGLNDSTIYDTQTGVIVDGTNFNATQSPSKLYLCDAADGSGTNVEQTVTNWTASAITFTVVRGALSLGSVYVIVARNQSSLGDTAERFSNSQSATLEAVPANPIITVVGGDNSVVETETGVAVVGSNFEASQGSGVVEICPGATYSGGSAVEQTVDTWGASSIDIDIVLGSLNLGVNYLFVTTDSALRNPTGWLITITVAPISDGLWKTANLQGTITSAGLTSTAFMIRDE